MFTDPMGLDAILINIPTEPGITNRLGQEHMSILMQDKNGQWFYNAFMGDHIIYAAISKDIDVTDLGSLNEWLKENGIVDKAWYDFTRSAYVEGDFTAPLDMIARYKDKPDEKYQKLANQVEYSPDGIQSRLDNLARKVANENFSTTYSPVFNNCGHVAMSWFYMGLLPNSDITYDEARNSFGSRAFEAIFAPSGMDIYELISPNQMFDAIYDRYATKSKSKR